MNSLLSKLSKTVFMFGQLKNYLDINVFKVGFFSVFHTHKSHGVILWGNSSYVMKVFITKKKLIRILFGVSLEEHCKSFFSNLQIMLLPFVYIYFSLLEIHKNKHEFITHSPLHSYPRRKKILF